MHTPAALGVALFTVARIVLPREKMTSEERRSHSAALQEMRRRLQEVKDAGNPLPLEMYGKVKGHRDIAMWLQKFKEDKDFDFVQETKAHIESKESRQEEQHGV